MRLLYLTPTAAMGGAERVLLDILAMIRRTRPAWTVGLILGNDGALATEARRLGVETIVLPFPREFARLGDTSLTSIGAWLRFIRRAAVAVVALVGYVRRLSAAINAFAPDTLHSNGFKMHVLSAVASKPPRATLVWHFHDYLSSRRVTGRIIRRLKHRCHAIVAVSRSVADDIERVLGTDPPVTPIWNAVDLDRFRPDGPALDLDSLANLGPAPPGILRVGLVATFARWKGHLIFLEALKELAPRYPLRAYIIGGPLYETDGSQITVSELKAAIEHLNLESSVGLTGFVVDSAAALRSLDIVVHTSTAKEPFGLVIAEAMACGRPVVVSNSGGVAELVQPDVNALTYEAGNPTGLSVQIERLLRDDVLRHRLGDAARSAAMEQFKPSMMESRLLTVYGTFGRKEAA